MRLQLTLAALGAALGGTLVATTPAHADGSLSARGVYYKERSTRVIQPMLDGMFEVGERGLVTAHFLVDAITSASAGSGAANAAAFTEQRYEGGATYTHELDAPAALAYVDKFRLSGTGKFSTESDYPSIYGGGRIEADLAQKNALVGVGGGVSIDQVTNAGAQSPMGGPLLLCDNTQKTPTETACPLDTYSLTASASQIVSKNGIVAIGYDLEKLSGFQSNAYRQVITSTGLVAEKHPNDRLRQAFAVSTRWYVPASQTTLIAAYRYYRDDWHIRAHTPELRIVQQVGIDADAAIRFRYYTQTAAFFYEPRYGDPMTMSIPYLTDDPKMSAFTGQTMEAKLGVLGHAFELGGRWSAARFEGILEYVVQHNRFGNAVVAHVALTLPIEY